MKKILLITLLSVPALTLFSQTKSEKEVAQAIEELRNAMVDADSARLMSLTYKELSYGHSFGRIETQQLFVSNLASGKSDFENMDITNQTISVVGNTAIVRHNLQGMASDMGKRAAVNLNVFMVWVKEKGKWKLLGRQAIKAVS
jgi:ketosteroid isomerase-like protein